ncbi:MAG: hypothetical protein LH630_10545 [Actinomycetia bacterium]|nr:hypothetical protein [Actinomycetes bacterium]
MPRTLPAPVIAAIAARHGVITRQQLLSLGASERNIGTWVRRGQLWRLSAGCFAESALWERAAPSLRHTMHVYGIQLISPDVVARGATSAVTWQLPVRSIPDRPQVLRAPNRAHLASASVQRRRLDPGHAVTRRGLTTLTLAHTVVDVAAVASLPDALITVDAALRGGLRLTDLEAALRSRGTFTGWSNAAAAIDAGDPAAESALESLSRGRVIERRLPLPLCNVVIKHQRREARVDKLWVEDGVVGEADGKSKYSKEDAPTVIWKEKRRHEWLEELGLAVPRWGMPEVGDDGAALERRYRKAVATQRAVGFRWPDGVTIEVPRLPGVELPARVLAEVKRLAASGYPISIGDARRRPGGSPALWTPVSA